MATLLTARGIAEKALELVGSYSVNDGAADGEELRRALHWLDLNMAQLSGSTHVFWLVTETLTVDLVADQQDYDLKVALGADYPADKILFPVEAWREDTGGNRYPLQLVDVHTFEGVTDPDQSGQPKMALIDRIADPPVMRLHPVPDDTEWDVKLRCQTFSPTVAPADSSEAHLGSAATGLRECWQRWAIYQTAFDIGNGPVRRQRGDVLSGFKAVADEAKAMLEGYENRSHDTMPPIAQAWDYPS